MACSAEEHRHVQEPRHALQQQSFYCSATCCSTRGVVAPHCAAHHAKNIFLHACSALYLDAVLQMRSFAQRKLQRLFIFFFFRAPEMRIVLGPIIFGHATGRPLLAVYIALARHRLLVRGLGLLYRCIYIRLSFLRMSVYLLQQRHALVTRADTFAFEARDFSGPRGISAALMRFIIARRKYISIRIRK